MRTPPACEDQAEIVLGYSPGGMPPEGGFDLEFRREIAQMVHDSVKFAYKDYKKSTIKMADRSRLTVERLVASSLADRIMDKVDREYI
jgi:hypothetical protein